MAGRGQVSCSAHSGGVCLRRTLPVPQRLPQHLRGWAEAFSDGSQCVCLELDPDGETWSLVALGASGTLCCWLLPRVCCLWIYCIWHESLSGEMAVGR